jgi:hypothetical protein
MLFVDKIDFRIKNVHNEENQANTSEGILSLRP